MSENSQTHKMDQGQASNSDAANGLSSEPVMDGAQSDESQGAGLELRLATLEAELLEWKSKYSYLLADVENMKKRNAKERLDLVRFANEELLKKLFPVLDNLEFAVKAVQDAGVKMEESLRSNAMFSNLVKGVEMTLKHFEQTLEQLGVQPVQGIGSSFDPEKHEAIGQSSDPSLPADVVSSQMQRGFLLHGKVLRTARVIVNKNESSSVN